MIALRSGLGEWSPDRADAERNLPFSLLGVAGVFLYHEPFTMRSLASFACIRVGVVLFCVDLWKRESRRN